MPRILSNTIIDVSVSKLNYKIFYKFNTALTFHLTTLPKVLVMKSVRYKSAQFFFQFIKCVRYKVPPECVQRIKVYFFTQPKYVPK